MPSSILVSSSRIVFTRPCSVSIALITANGPKNPTAEEWAAFAASRNLGYMGTHLRALLTGEQCPKGLICLGCAHAQPKKSAGPIFRRMLASHERSLVAARSHSEPADRSRPAPYFVNALQAGSFGIWVHFRKVRRQPISYRFGKDCPSLRKNHRNVRWIHVLRTARDKRVSSWFDLCEELSGIANS